MSAFFEKFKDLISRKTLAKTTNSILGHFKYPLITGYLPNVLTIEPTNICNLHCPLCPTGAGQMNRPGRMMRLDEFIKIIDEAHGHVSHITFWNYGEPFLNKDLLAMIKYATAAGMSVVTSTNGQFITSESFAEEVVRSGLHQLLIDLDGASQKTVEIYRRGSDFKKIIENIRLLVAAKKKLNSSTPIIEVQFIVMRHNEEEIDAVRHLAEKLGVDVFREKLVGLDVNDPEFQKLAKQFLPDNPIYRRYERLEDGTYQLIGVPSNYCSLIYSQMVINSDGTVVPCCYDLWSDHIMGNAFEQKLTEIWRGEKFQEFRSQIRKDRKSIAMCNICPESRMNISKSAKLKIE